MNAKNKVVTFGCRLNTYESQVVQKALLDSGVEDVTVFNTCAVTQEAERQARQAIRKHKREHPEKTIVVTGCAAQIRPDVFTQMPEVDRVLGNVDKLKAESYTSKNNVLVEDIMNVKTLASHMVTAFDGRSRAFIQIQNGCNHRCTFCTIPYGRGPSRSVPPDQLIQEIQSLLNKGYREFVLTGVDITDYGLDLHPNISLGQLIQTLLDTLPDLMRLRLSSLDPSEMDEVLWKLLEHESRLLPHVHLSLQAGSDLVLKRMKRRHLRHHVFEFIERIRSIRPTTVIGADIIAGFPTETEHQFQETLAILDYLDLVHVFPFSAHENTPASKMPQVSHQEIKRRAKLLRERAKERLDAVRNRMIGRHDHLLIEKTDEGFVYGKTDHFLPCRLDRVDCSIGDVLPIRVLSVDSTGLKAEHQT